MSSSLRLALVQLKSGADKSTNIQHAQDFIIKASSETKADMIVLPECWNSPYSTASFPIYAEEIPKVGGQVDPINHPSTKMLTDISKRLGIWLVGGSFPERDSSSGSEKLYNTCLVIDPNGNICGKHRKVHLFGKTTVEALFMTRTTIYTSYFDT
jgi:omega-amidase